MTIGSFLEKKRIREYITKYNMLSKGDGVVLGLSGGPDSVCLFYVLLAIKDEYDLHIRLAHVNHMIRGKQADEDQAFVEKLGNDHGIDVDVLRVDIPALAQEYNQSVEEAARNVRYQFFDEIAAEMTNNGVRQVKIAIAHNANDNAETVLFHMARGAGLDGMCGISPVRGNIIRPLLPIAKSEIVDFLNDNHYEYRIDATNQDVEYSRNRLRHNVMPELEQVNDRALDHIFEMTERLSEIASYIQLEADGLLCMAKEEGDRLRKRTLITAPKVVRNQAIKTYLSKYMPDEKDVSQIHIDAVVANLTLDGERYVDLPHKKRVIISYDEIFIIDTSEEENDNSSQGCFEFRELAYESGMSYPRNTYTKWFDYDKIEGNIEVRTRLEGDFLTINSEGGTKTLKQFFIDEKIPKHLRDNIPLVCDGNHVMWIVGYRISEYYKVSDKTTRILEVNYMEEDLKNE